MHRAKEAVPRARDVPGGTWPSPAQAAKQGWSSRRAPARYLQRVGEQHNEVLQVQHQAGVRAVGLERRERGKHSSETAWNSTKPSPEPCCAGLVQLSLLPVLLSRLEKVWGCPRDG